MRKSLILLLFILLGSIFNLRPVASTSGNIEGRVIDQNGAIVPNVPYGTNAATGLTRSAQSDSDGNYIFVLLRGPLYGRNRGGPGFGVASMRMWSSRSVRKTRSDSARGRLQRQRCRVTAVPGLRSRELHLVYRRRNSGDQSADQRPELP